MRKHKFTFNRRSCFAPRPSTPSHCRQWEPASRWIHDRAQHPSMPPNFSPSPSCSAAQSVHGIWCNSSLCYFGRASRKKTWLKETDKSMRTRTMLLRFFKKYPITNIYRPRGNKQRSCLINISPDRLNRASWVFIYLHRVIHTVFVVCFTFLSRVAVSNTDPFSCLQSLAGLHATLGREVSVRRQPLWRGQSSFHIALSFVIIFHPQNEKLTFNSFSLLEDLFIASVSSTWI